MSQLTTSLPLRCLASVVSKWYRTYARDQPAVHTPSSYTNNIVSILRLNLVQPMLYKLQLQVPALQQTFSHTDICSMP